MHSMLQPSYSFIGRRKNNEDSYIYGNEFSPYIQIFAVADGMGGANAGEVASRMAIDSIYTYLKDKLGVKTDFTEIEIKKIILDGYSKIQKDIAKAIIDNPALSGMGTTLVLLLKAGKKWFWANIGDSRLYLIKKDSIELLTKDHSYLQQYVDSHNEQPDEEWIAKFSNYITKALDGTDNEPDIYQFEAEKELIADESCFLLCSDGLLTANKSISESALFNIVKNTENARTAVEQLISNAYYDGSTDNITVLLVEGPRFVRSTKPYKKLPFPPGAELKAGTKSIQPRMFLYFSITCLVLCLCAISYIIIKPDHVREQKNYSIDSPSKQKYVQSPKVENLGPSVSNWLAFDPDDYRLPVRDSTMLIWNKLKSSGTISCYKIYLYFEGQSIDSLTVNPVVNSIKFGELKHIKRGKKYNVSIKAIMDNYSDVFGNSFTINYY